MNYVGRRDMKKRIAAALLAGALAVSGTAGLSACGGLSLPKGDEVTKEQWTAAIENMIVRDSEIPDNCTLEFSHSEKKTVKGKGAILFHDEWEEFDISDAREAAENKMMLYDKPGNRAYRESRSQFKEITEKGVETRNYVSKSYCEPNVQKEDGYYWEAEYSLSKEEDGDGECDERENDWSACETSWFPSGDNFNYGGNFASPRDVFEWGLFYETDDEEAEPQRIADLYEKFTYSGGVYTASLYGYRTVGDYHAPAATLIPCVFSISFNNAEGCVIGYEVKWEGAGTLFGKKSGFFDGEIEYNFDYTYKCETVYSITNINKTDAAKKRNGDIAKAIEKAKAIK